MWFVLTIVKLCMQIFTGIGLGCIAAGATQVTDGMMAAAARAVAGCVTDAELRRDSVLPDVDRIGCAHDLCVLSACPGLITDGLDDSVTSNA